MERRSKLDKLLIIIQNEDIAGFIHKVDYYFEFSTYFGYKKIPYFKILTVFEIKTDCFINILISFKGDKTSRLGDLGLLRPKLPSVNQLLRVIFVPLQNFKL